MFAPSALSDALALNALADPPTAGTAPTFSPSEFSSALDQYLRLTKERLEKAGKGESVKRKK
jgi:hypothetical protein